jgi:hypothetical protein
MPTTVGGYHLFQLNIAGQWGAKDYEESITFTTLRNDLSDGFRSKILFGSGNGVRMFKLGLPSLTGSSMDSRTVTGINGETLTWENYIWELYCETQRTGEPFAIQSQRNNQYYLVEFVNEQLSYQRLLTKLFSTGIELRQIRVQGETVWDFANHEAIWAWFPSSFYDQFAEPDGSPVTETWIDQSPGTSDNSIDPTGTITYETNEANGYSIVRLDGTDGYFSTTLSATTIHEAFIVMKARAATWASFSGVLTKLASSSAPILLGDDGTTKFYNNGFGTGFLYELNGVEYAEANQQAPMNEWGLVHVRYTTGWPIDGIQIGKDRAEAARFAAIDVAEIAIFEDLLPRSDAREITEHLLVKYALT